MKNGIYIEYFSSYWIKCKIHYKDDRAFKVEFPDGEIRYFKPYKELENKLLHREDGPAIVCKNENECEWYYEGNNIPVSNQEEFERYLLLQAFK